MKLEPMNSPAQGPIHGAKAEPQVSAREKAIQALMGNAPQSQQSTPVSNPTRVAPEEMTAISASNPKSFSQKISQSVAEAGQLDSNEGVASEADAESKAAETPLSSQYAILARKEKALRQREAALKAKEAALEPAKPAAPQTPTFDESKYIPRDRLTQDPFTVLNELGLTYDQLTEMALKGPSSESMQLMSEVKALKAELQSLKGETESTKKSFEQQQKQQYDQALKQFRHDAERLIKNDPSFETIKATDSIGDVVELIEKTFTEDGHLMTVEEAAREVEEYLVNEALKLARLTKIQQRLAPAPASAPKSTGQPKQAEMRTLTNSVSSTRQLSARERAVLAAEGKLK